nr:efflux RND transporter periplasmic adaptor subunit [Deltaproteobacteria bacterium]
AARQQLRAIGGERARRGPILYEVRAPLAGIVTERRVVVGDPVTTQSVVATIVAIDEVWFLAHVFERDVALAREGSTASVVLNAYPDDSFEGTLTRISYEVDPGARTLSARIPLLNEDDRLRLGLFGTAFVSIGEHVDEPRLTVPRSAVIEVLGAPTVFVEQSDGHLERHEVVLGESDTTHVEIVHGLRAGERVVTEGTFSVKAVLLRSTIAEDHH